MQNRNVQIEYLMVCDYTIREADTNKTSLIGIFQEIYLLNDSDSVAIPLTVFARINNPPKEIKSTISIIDPDNQEISKVKIDGPVNSESVNIHANFKLVNFKKIGKHRIKIVINEETINSNNTGITVIKKL